MSEPINLDSIRTLALTSALVEVARLRAENADLAVCHNLGCKVVYYVQAETCPACDLRAEIAELRGRVAFWRDSSYAYREKLYNKPANATGRPGNGHLSPERAVRVQPDPGQDGGAGA